MHYYPEITDVKVFVVDMSCGYQGYHVHFTRIYTAPVVVTRREMIPPQRSTHNLRYTKLLLLQEAGYVYSGKSMAYEGALFSARHGVICRPRYSQILLNFIM